MGSKQKEQIRFLDSTAQKIELLEFHVKSNQKLGLMLL